MNLALLQCQIYCTILNFYSKKMFLFLKRACLVGRHHMIFQWLIFSKLSLANSTMELWINATRIIQMMSKITSAVCTFIRSATTIWTRQWIVFQILITTWKHNVYKSSKVYIADKIISIYKFQSAKFCFWRVFYVYFWKDR